MKKATALKKSTSSPNGARLSARKLKNKGKVLMALSGGIDSAVSAYLLLQQGYEVEAAFMKNWSSTAGLLKNECPWLVDRQDALRVAAFLRIPMHTLDFEKQYERTVMKYFFEEYKAGRTPNPDVMCNKEIKFKLLYNWAMKNGFDYVATGHYARVGKSVQPRINIRGMNIRAKKKRGIEDSHTLLRSVDEFKDQTYFIYNIKTEQLPHILFPIGGLKKPLVRAMAKKIGLPNADKRESMGLCFVGKIRLKDFLEQKLKPKMGPIIDQYNKKIGQHDGLYNYTIGQRQGIKVGGGGPYFVLKKDLKNNALYVTNDPNDKGLLTKEVDIHRVNWIGKQASMFLHQNTSSSQNNKINLLGRYRHQGQLVPVVVEKIRKDHCRVTFAKPQKAIASGQSLVLYRGKECIGGGVIV